MIAKLWAILVPMLFGSIAAWMYLRKITKKKAPGFSNGFTTWTTFLFWAFIGEVFAHVVFSSAYRGLGDNPTQLVGFAINLLTSPLICTLLFFSFRRKHKKSKLITDNKPPPL